MILLLGVEGVKWQEGRLIEVPCRCCLRTRKAVALVGRSYCNSVEMCFITDYLNLIYEL